MKNLLEKHFDAAFDAPDGIQKLRELILTLAMQGKLVPQDPNDQPASELLEEIDAEKQRLVREGKIKKSKPLPGISTEEMPYELPKGWEWVRLGEISEINGGFAFKSSQYVDDGIRIVRISDFDEKGFKQSKIVRYSYSEEIKNYLLKADDILMAMTGGTVGKKILVDKLSEPMVVNQRVATIRCNCYLVPKYISNSLQTSFVQSEILNAKNSTNDNISMTTIKTFLVPLPPLSEQRRIVDKIDQLMARCDELEKLRTEQGKKRIKAHTSAVSRLQSAPNREDFDLSWQFITRHFSELYSVKENVVELRKAILQLAMQGKLVPQDPNDKPASDLLEEIETEKQRLLREGKIKKSRPLPEIKPEEIPYDLPKGWVWVRLGDVFDVRDGTHDTPKYVDNGYPLITSKNLSSGQLCFQNVKYISNEDHQKITQRSKVDKGDILFAMIGSIGNPIVVSSEKEFSIKNVALFKFYKFGEPENTYLYYFLYLSQQRMKATSSGAVQSFVSLGFLRKFIFPLPPLSEQRRIVFKIDQLMACCDELEKQIEASSKKQNILLESVLSFGTALI